MINVVGAGEDPENLTSPTLYNFTPNKKQPPAPVTPVVVESSPPVAMAAVPANSSVPAPEPLLETPISEPPITPETEIAPVVPLEPKPPKKSLKTIVIAGVIGLLLVGGMGAALYLGQTNQDVRQQASTASIDGNTEVDTVIPTSEPTTEPEPTAEPTQPVLEEEVETLALAPTLTPTQAITPTPILINTAEFCGQSCLNDENCQNPSHSCVSGSCKLATNPTSVSCKTPSGGTQIEWDETQPQRTYSPYAELSGETPQSGPADWLRFWWLGVSAVGVGAALLLFL